MMIIGGCCSAVTLFELAAGTGYTYLITHPWHDGDREKYSC